MLVASKISNWYHSHFSTECGYRLRYRHTPSYPNLHPNQNDIYTKSTHCSHHHFRAWISVSLVWLGVYYKTLILLCSTVVAGIFRTIYLQRAVDPLILDKTWETFNTFVAGTAETEIALICACAPSLNRLFGRVFLGASVS